MPRSSKNISKVFRRLSKRLISEELKMAQETETAEVTNYSDYDFEFNTLPNGECHLANCSCYHCDDWIDDHIPNCNCPDCNPRNDRDTYNILN